MYWNFMISSQKYNVKVVFLAKKINCVNDLKLTLFYIFQSINMFSSDLCNNTELAQNSTRHCKKKIDMQLMFSKFRENQCGIYWKTWIQFTILNHQRVRLQRLMLKVCIISGIECVNAYLFYYALMLKWINEAL